MRIIVLGQYIRDAVVAAVAVVIVVAAVAVVVMNDTTSKNGESTISVSTDTIRIMSVSLHQPHQQTHCVNTTSPLYSTLPLLSLSLSSSNENRSS